MNKLTIYIVIIMTDKSTRGWNRLLRYHLAIVIIFDKICYLAII